MKTKFLLLICFMVFGLYGFEKSGIFYLRNSKLVDTKASIGFQYDNENNYNIAM